MKDEVSKIAGGTPIQTRTLFKPGSWLAKIDFINHLILFNNVLITVLAEKEGGKTSFTTLLQNNLDKQVQPVFMQAKQICDETRIIKQLAKQLDLSAKTYTDIASIVAAVNERKAHVFFIIDDAQNVPASFIKEAMVCIKNQGDFGFFHLCLVSDYSIVEILDKLSVDPFNNLVHSIDLGPLNENETRTYVLQRAMAANLITLPLPDTYFKKFYQLTKGNLAKINSSMESYILNCKPEKKNPPKCTVQRTSMTFSIIAVSACAYLYFATLNNDAATTKAAQIVQQASSTAAGSEVASHAATEELLSYIPSWEVNSTIQLVEFATPKQGLLDDEDDGESIMMNNTVALVDKVLVIPKIKPGPELTTDIAMDAKGSELAQEELLEEELVAAEAVPEKAVTEQVTKEEPATQELIKEEAPKEEPVNEAVGNDKTAQDEAAQDKVTQDNGTQEKVNQEKVVKETAPAIPEPVKPVTLKSPKPVVKAVIKTTKTTVAKKPAAKKPAHSFTIQLVASHKKSDVSRLRTSSAFLAATKVRHFTNEQGSWYVLTLGEYSSRNQAQLHVKTLPNELSKLHPWIRSVSGLIQVG